MAKFIVAITHGQGVIACEPYENMNGEYYANFIRNHFPHMLDEPDKETALFIQDGDPSQNSAVARNAMEEVNI